MTDLWILFLKRCIFPSILILNLFFFTQGGTALVGREHPYTMASSSDFVMDNVDCSGIERRLIDCMYLPRHDCQPHEIAAVRCHGK